MKVSIQPCGERLISELISSGFDLTLDSKEAGVLEFCQGMSSESWTGYVGEKLICCWGLIPPSLLSNQAYLWMYCTPLIREHQFLLVRHSQRIIEEALLRYPNIIGHCIRSAADSIRWLKWLGAEFGPSNERFIPFVIRSKVCG